MSRSSVKRSALLVATLAVFSASASAHENPLFGYTHMAPSPYTMKSGRLALGTDAALGLTDFLQIQTNLISDFYKFYNASAKASLIDYPEFALAVTFGWESFNYQDISNSNPDLRVVSLLPGMVTAFGLMDDVALFVAANLNYTNAQLVTTGVDTSGYVNGARVESDLSWAYNPKRKGVGNVLAAGVTYDFSYNVFGVGVSHHWPGFHIGMHYYPNASQYRVQPIIAGSTTVDF